MSTAISWKFNKYRAELPPKVAKVLNSEEF